MLRRNLTLLAGLLLLGFFLRVHGLDRVPPGWRDDEVIETTVHAQRVLRGEFPIFFREANGHEPLYHYVSAGAIALWGRGLLQVRLVSGFFGLLALAAHYRLARRLFGPRVALLAALALAVSFWALMYSRVKIRHVSALVFVLLAFDAFLYASRFTFRSPPYTLQPPRFALLPPLFLALSLYTYFAARAAPIVLIAFAAYLAAFHRAVFSARWRGLAQSLVVAAVLALPLAWAIRAQPNAEARLATVGAPLTALLGGDPRPALGGTLTTMGMFVWTGDPEALYNLPGRPVFEPLGAMLFVVGLIVCRARWRDPRYGFVLLWLIIGLSPAFVSTPGASLGHALVAQPAVYLILAIGMTGTLDYLAPRVERSRFIVHPLLVIVSLFIFSRDLRDYFLVWPRDPLVRHLYRAALREAANGLRETHISDVALTGRLSLWDARALELDAPGLQARWFNPEGALLYPANPEAPLVVFPDPPLSDWARARLTSDFGLASSSASFAVWNQVARSLPSVQDGQAEWTLGVRFGGYEPPGRARPGETAELQIAWRVGEGYAAPEPAIGASPDPPPQPFRTFVHVLGSDGQPIAGYDRFDADVFTLRAGDVIVQEYRLALPADLAPGNYTLETGFYDPVSGARFATRDGHDSFAFGILRVEK